MFPMTSGGQKAAMTAYISCPKCGETFDLKEVQLLSELTRTNGTMHDFYLRQLSTEVLVEICRDRILSSTFIGSDAKHELTMRQMMK
jgi:hypothetical protein